MGLKLMFFLLTFFQVNQSNYLDEFRNNYAKSVTDKVVCEQMISKIKKNTKDDVSLAYLGAYQTIWANHVLNPVSKLKTFIDGKKNIEKAIKNNPKNIEIRILRYSVQKNAPKFLGYYENINEDLNYINKHKSSIESNSLKKIVSNL